MSGVHYLPIMLATSTLGYPALSLGEPEAPTLPEVSVTAKGYAAPDLETPQATVNLAPEATAPAAPAGALFRGEAGLATQSDGAWGQNPVVRGLKKESIVVMMDGTRVNSAQPQGALASFLDLGLVDRVEVVKGPTSVLYGSGAMGGVVNLLTPEPAFAKSSGWNGRFGLGASSVDSGYSTSVLGNFSAPNSAAVVGAALRQADDYESPAGEIANSGYSSDSLLAKFRRRLVGDTSLTLNLQRHADHDVWYPGSARTGGQPGGAGIPPVLGTVTIHSPEQSRTLYELGLETRLAGGRLDVDLYRQEVVREIKAFSSRLGRDYVRNEVTFATDGVRGKYLREIGDNQLLTVGLDTWTMTGDPERYQDTNAPQFNNNVRTDPFRDGEIRSTGLFVQDEITLGKTQVVAGARFDRIDGDAARMGTGAAARTTGLDHSDDTVSWSLGVIHEASPLLRPYVNLGQAYRAADMRERFEDSARGDGYYVLGNPQLEPEHSTSFELGLKGSEKGVEYRLAAFHTRIDDYIAGRVTGANHPASGLPIKLTENLDEVVICGLEGEGSVPVGRFVADAAFTWLKGENRQDDEPLAETPPPELRLGFGQPSERGLHWRGQVRTVAEQNRIATKFSNGTENVTDAFTTVEFNAGWHFGKVGAFSTLDLDVALTNLLDEDYHEHLTQGVSGNEVSAPGRGVAFALTGRF
ncbi:MAG: TonB-dependent receptor plug domain-containing protein [Thiotrichales bacterium]